MLPHPMFSGLNAWRENSSTLVFRRAVNQQHSACHAAQVCGQGWSFYQQLDHFRDLPGVQRLDPDLIWSGYLCCCCLQPLLVSILTASGNSGYVIFPWLRYKWRIIKRSENRYIFWGKSLLDFKKKLFPNFHVSR